MKKLTLGIAAAATALAAAVGSLAYTSSSTGAKALALKEVEYKKNGVVEVEFNRDVRYSSPTVTVKDSAGKTYAASITGKDDDELTFKVKGLAVGMDYTVQVSGVTARGESNTQTLAGTFKTYSGFKTRPGYSDSIAPTVEEIEYKGNGRLEVDFFNKVKWESGAKATVVDSTGKAYAVSLTGKDSDDCTLRVTGLKAGETYTFIIEGAKLRADGSAATITGTFQATRGYKYEPDGDDDDWYDGDWDDDDWDDRHDDDDDDDDWDD